MTTSSTFTTADALIVVDVQQALVRGPHAVADADALVARLRGLLVAARTVGVPVVHLQDDGTEQGSLIPHGTQGWQLVLDVADGEQVVHKAQDDGFAGTDLEHLLDGARRPCVVGIQSEMCVAATARGALERGLTVVLPRDGHATYGIPAEGDAPAVPFALTSRVAEWSLGDSIIAPDRTADVVFVRGTR